MPWGTNWAHFSCFWILVCSIESAFCHLSWCCRRKSAEKFGVVVRTTLFLTEILTLATTGILLATKERVALITSRCSLASRTGLDVLLVTTTSLFFSRASFLCLAVGLGASSTVGRVVLVVLVVLVVVVTAAAAYDFGAAFNCWWCCCCCCWDWEIWEI